MQLKLFQRGWALLKMSAESFVNGQKLCLTHLAETKRL